MSSREKLIKKIIEHSVYKDVYKKAKELAKKWKKVNSLEELRKFLEELGFKPFIYIFEKYIDVWKNPFQKEVYDFLMGVGKKYYPTEVHFLEEAFRMGISKRAPQLPKGLVLGKSRIYLVHWGSRRIFAVFVPALQLVVLTKEEKELIIIFLEVLRLVGVDIAVVPLTLSEVIANEGARYCGSRRAGRYVVA